MFRGVIVNPDKVKLQKMCYVTDLIIILKDTYRGKFCDFAAEFLVYNSKNKGFRTLKPSFAYTNVLIPVILVGLMIF
jgi:hypothetical protein